MIELGQIRAGVVVGTESGRALVESTIAHLNADTSLSRQDIKTAFASLTIGSRQRGDRAVRSRTEPHRQPSAGRRHADRHRALRAVPRRPRASAPQPPARATSSGRLPMLMATDSEALMREGVAAAQAGLRRVSRRNALEGRRHPEDVLPSSRPRPSSACCSSRSGSTSGSTSRRSSISATPARPPCPRPPSIGIENGHVQPGDRVALLGIGSGINVMMLGVEWQTS